MISFRWYDKKKRKILILGLPKSGKTSNIIEIWYNALNHIAFLKKLTKNEFTTSYTPTLDVNMEDYKLKNLNLILFVRNITIF